MARAVICKDDPTSHGGKVLEGNENATCLGKPIALKGHQTYCPLCKGQFPIAEGLGHHSFGGIGTAVEGMKTACGATLIASQHVMTVDDGGGAAADAKNSPAPPGCRSGGHLRLRRYFPRHRPADRRTDRWPPLPNRIA